MEHGLFLRLIVQVHGWLNAFLTTRPALDAVSKSNFGRRRRAARFHTANVTVEDLAALATRSGAAPVCVAPVSDDAPVAAAARRRLACGIVVAVPAARLYLRSSARARGAVVRASPRSYH